MILETIGTSKGENAPLINIINEPLLLLNFRQVDIPLESFESKFHIFKITHYFNN